MPARAKNLNLSRRPLPGLLARLLTPILKPLLRVLRQDGDSVLTVYASYMVGDFFMALPALRLLKKSADKSANSRPLRVLCRPDCVEFLAREGILAVPIDDAFRRAPGVGTFLRTGRAAWALRGRIGDTVLDLDADPRTAFWMKLAGVRRTVSYRRDSGSLFDETFALPTPSVHQADRDLRVIEEWIRREGLPVVSVTDLDSPASAHATPATAPWILSVWTRKPAKNWPLEQWEAFLGSLDAEGVPFLILDAPDGDANFAGFRERWNARSNGHTRFLRGTLVEIAEAVRHSAGVIATDNFLGHMAGYYGKPVLWINLCSPAAQVVPRGPRTIAATNPSVDEVRAAFRSLTN